MADSNQTQPVDIMNMFLNAQTAIITLDTKTSYIMLDYTKVFKSSALLWCLKIVQIWCHNISVTWVRIPAWEEQKNCESKLTDLTFLG